MIFSLHYLLPLKTNHHRSTVISQPNKTLHLGLVLPVEFGNHVVEKHFKHLKRIDLPHASTKYWSDDAVGTVQFSHKEV
jgi:hypothetical protein